MKNQIIDPFFSIVMPVYNVEKYVEEAVLSVLDQSYSDFELIIIDDGSTDRSCEICEKYKQKDERVRIIHQSNKGRLLARRRGIDHSFGKYIINVDADDRIDDHLLEILHHYISSCHPDVLSYCWAVFDDRNRILLKQKLYEEPVKGFTKQEFINEIVVHWELYSVCTKAVKREAYGIGENYNHYGQLNMAEDLLLTAAVIEKAEKFLWIDKPLYYYRDNPESITNNFRPQNAIDSTKAKRRVFEMLDHCNHCPETYKKYINKYYQTLNTYVLKSAFVIKKPDSFYAFRKQLRAVEVESKIEKASPLNRILYKIGNREIFLLIKVISYHYIICKKTGLL